MGCSASRMSVGIGARRVACDFVWSLNFTVSTSSLLSQITFAASGFVRSVEYATRCLSKGLCWRTCSVDKFNVIQLWDCVTDSLIPLVLDCNKSFAPSGTAVCSDLQERSCFVLIGERVLRVLTVARVLEINFRPRYHSSVSVGDHYQSQSNPVGLIR
jgi:hypothetical protein